MSLPFASVVICTFNRATQLRDTLHSVLRQQVSSDQRFEIIVVDNDSTDETPSVCEQFAREDDRLRCFHESRAGLAFARNRGIREAQGEWIAFIDDDELAEQRWLAQLLDFAAESGAQLVGGAVRLALKEEELRLLPRTCRVHLGETAGLERPHRCRRNRLPGAGNLLVRRSLLLEVGGFDESRTAGGEDLLLNIVLRKKGVESWFTPKAVVYHRVPGYRLQPAYQMWLSRRYGENSAERDYREWGLARTWLLSLARVVYGALVSLPRLAWATLRGRQGAALERRCLLAKTATYVRKTLALTAPRRLAQKEYFEGLSFRQERDLFGGDNTADPEALPPGPSKS